jgi:hypothetical protein
MQNSSIPTDTKTRKQAPMAAGLFDYFPAALFSVANHSFIGNEKHNPGQPLHWSRGNSTDHADCIARHLIERGGFEDVEYNGVKYRVRHSAALAWRALALLQEELEAEGWMPGRGSVFQNTTADKWTDEELDDMRNLGGGEAASFNRIGRVAPCVGHAYEEDDDLDPDDGERTSSAAR